MTDAQFEILVRAQHALAGEVLVLAFTAGMLIWCAVQVITALLGLVRALAERPKSISRDRRFRRVLIANAIKQERERAWKKRLWRHARRVAQTQEARS